MNIVIYTVVILTIFYLLLKKFTTISSNKISKSMRILLVIGLFIHFSNCLHVCCTHFACFRGLLTCENSNCLASRFLGRPSVGAGYRSERRVRRSRHPSHVAARVSFGAGYDRKRVESRDGPAAGCRRRRHRLRAEGERPRWASFSSSIVRGQGRVRQRGGAHGRQPRVHQPLVGSHTRLEAILGVREEDAVAGRQAEAHRCVLFFLLGG